jgi:hypothetical protein
VLLKAIEGQTFESIATRGGREARRRYLDILSRSECP